MLPVSYTHLHATSQGKLLLSQLPDATVRYLMNGQGMDPFTPQTIVDLATLTEELERIRQWGYARSDCWDIEFFMKKFSCFKA